MEKKLGMFFLICGFFTGDIRRAAVTVRQLALLRRALRHRRVCRNQHRWSWKRPPIWLCTPHRPTLIPWIRRRPVRLRLRGRLIRPHTPAIHPATLPTPIRAPIVLARAEPIRLLGKLEIRHIRPRSKRALLRPALGPRTGPKHVRHRGLLIPRRLVRVRITRRRGREAGLGFEPRKGRGISRFQTGHIIVIPERFIHHAWLPELLRRRRSGSGHGGGVILPEVVVTFGGGVPGRETGLEITVGGWAVRGSGWLQLRWLLGLLVVLSGGWEIVWRFWGGLDGFEWERGGSGGGLVVGWGWSGRRGWGAAGLHGWAGVFGPVGLVCNGWLGKIEVNGIAGIGAEKKKQLFRNSLIDVYSTKDSVGGEFSAWRTAILFAIVSFGDVTCLCGGLVLEAEKHHKNMSQFCFILQRG